MLRLSCHLLRFTTQNYAIIYQNWVVTAKLIKSPYHVLLMHMAGTCMHTLTTPQPALKFSRHCLHLLSQLQLCTYFHLHRDPFIPGNNILVLCETYDVDGSPHRTNTRHSFAKVCTLPDLRNAPFLLIRESFLLRKFPTILYTYTSQCMLSSPYPLPSHFLFLFHRSPYLLPPSLSLLSLSSLIPLPLSPVR